MLCMTSIKFLAANQLKELIGKIRDELGFRGITRPLKARRSYFESQLNHFVELSNELRRSQEFETAETIKKVGDDFSAQYKKVIELLMKEE